MGKESITGRQAVLYRAVKGTAIDTGDADNSAWYKVVSIASTGSVVPSVIKEGEIYKTAPSGTLTLGSGDELIPITLTVICRVDIATTATKGTIDITDSCTDGFNAYLIDGYTDISGSFTAYLKTDDSTGELSENAELFLNKCYDIVKMDSSGTYTRAEQNDDDEILFIEWDKRKTASGNFRQWLILPIIITEVPSDKPLKGPQNLDVSFMVSQEFKPVIFQEEVA